MIKDKFINNKGFTLMELVIVIVIIGILSAIMVPKYMNLLTSIHMKAAREKILDDLRYIENYAISHHDTTWIVMDQNNNSYTLYQGPTSTNRQILHDPSTNQNAVINIGVLFSGVYISQLNFSGATEVFFDWYGTPSAGGNIVLNQQKVIHVTPGSGYIYESTSLASPPPP